MFTEKEKDSKRFEMAWESARKAAEILKTNFKAKRVFVFGSLVKPDYFDNNSDIDLAVEGIDEALFYKALGKIISNIDTFKIDLVDYDNCSDVLLKAINREGVEL